MVKCDEIQELEKVNPEKIYIKIKKVVGKRYMVRNNIIKDKDGKTLVEIADVMKRWEGYVVDLW